MPGAGAGRVMDPFYPLAATHMNRPEPVLVTERAIGVARSAARTRWASKSTWCGQAFED